MKKAEIASYRMSFQPMIYDIDAAGSISLRSLFNYMQGSADMHSRFLGTSLCDFALEGYTWVYARYFFRILRYPESYKPLSVETWRSRASGMMALREFRITDETGPLALATSWLALIDRSTRKPVNIPENILMQFSEHLGRAIDVDPAPLKWHGDMDAGKNCTVRYSDLDVNGHVNNAAYLDYILEGMDDKLRNEKRLGEIQVDYKAEALLGDNMLSSTINTDECRMMHRLKRSSDNKTLCLASSTWR